MEPAEGEKSSDGVVGKDEETRARDSLPFRGRDEETSGIERDER